MARTNALPLASGSTQPPGFRVVPEHVARNPVARAVAKARLMQAVRDFLLRLYMLPDGAAVHADADASARVLGVAIEVCRLRGQEHDADCRVMRGAMGALVALAQRRCLWRRADAVALDTALQRAVAVYEAATPQQVQQAWVRLARMSTAPNA